MFSTISTLLTVFADRSWSRAPAHDRIDLATTRREHQAIEPRPPSLRAADAFVQELVASGPAARGDVAAQFQQLVLGVLVVGADPSVERDSHFVLRVGLLDVDLIDGSIALKDRDGIAAAEAVRRAIAAFLAAKGITLPTTPTRRPATDRSAGRSVGGASLASQPVALPRRQIVARWP